MYYFVCFISFNDKYHKTLITEILILHLIWELGERILYKNYCLLASNQKLFVIFLIRL